MREELYKQILRPFLRAVIQNTKITDYFTKSGLERSCIDTRDALGINYFF